MSTSKYFDAIVAVVLALGLALTVAFVNGEALGVAVIVDEDAEAYEATAYFTANDLNGDWDASNPTATVALSGDRATVRGNGAYYNDGSVVITGAGRYVFSGALDDGNIVVDAYDASKVFLLFDGVALYCSDDACLRVENAEKVFLTLAAGSVNRMESGETYAQTALDDNTGGVIFAHDDLTVNGSGSLELVANYKHGIDANDDLRITGGELTITCPQDGLHVNDSFRLANASVTVAAGDDAIHSDTDVYIESGTLLITECYEGIEAPQILIAGGDVTIYPTDDGFNASNGGGGDAGFGFGFGGERPSFEDVDGELPTPPEWSEDGGARPELGGMPDMSGETPDTAAAGDDAELPCIRITGGTVTIINENARDADGLDSNGSIYIEGGTVFVSLKGDGSNNALDCGSESGGVAEISGGTVVAAGGASMAESFDASSTQPSVVYLTSAAAGTTVALTGADGAVLLTWDVPCSFTHLTVSCPALTLGETYTLAVGDAREEVTLASSVTTLGTSSGFEGMGGGFDRGSFGGERNADGGASFSERRGGHGTRGDAT